MAGKLGNGAVGVVRKVLRMRDDMEFAIKFLAPDPKYIDESVFDDVAARFRREGERGVNLRHEALVAIHAYDENRQGKAFTSTEPKNPFILMEIVKGRTLEDFIRREQLRPHWSGRKEFSLTPERLSIAVQVGEALRYLHAKKLIHRDVKPTNIFPLQRGARGLKPS